MDGLIGFLLGAHPSIHPVFADQTRAEERGG